MFAEIPHLLNRRSAFCMMAILLIAAFPSTALPGAMSTPEGVSHLFLGVEPISPGFEATVSASGGAVPYQIVTLYFDVLPLGIVDLIFDLETDLGIRQPALSEFSSEFAAAYPDASLGTPSGDDILNIGGYMPPNSITPGFGDFPPSVIVGSGELIVPPSPVGTQYTITPSLVEATIAFPGKPPLPVLATSYNPLTITVVPEPTMQMTACALLSPIAILSRSSRS